MCIRDRYKVLLDEVRELQPDAIIFLQAIFHTTQEKSDTTFFKNSTIDARHAEIQKFADNATVFYIDCNPVFDDDTGAPVSYTHLSDGQTAQGAQIRQGHSLPRFSYADHQRTEETELILPSKMCIRDSTHAGA